MTNRQRWEACSCRRTAISSSCINVRAGCNQPQESKRKHPSIETLPHECFQISLCAPTPVAIMSSPQPVTEMAFLPFPPNTPLHDPSTPAGAVWARVLHDVSLAPGYCSQHWGYNLSSPGQVWYLVGMYALFSFSPLQHGIYYPYFATPARRPGFASSYSQAAAQTGYPSMHTPATRPLRHVQASTKLYSPSSPHRHRHPRRICSMCGSRLDLVKYGMKKKKKP